MSKETPEDRFRAGLFSSSEAKPKPEPHLQGPSGDEPNFEFDWNVSRQDSSRGPIIVLELVNRADDNSATSLGFEPSAAKQLGEALTAKANL